MPQELRAWQFNQTHHRATLAFMLYNSLINFKIKMTDTNEEFDLLPKRKPKAPWAGPLIALAGLGGLAFLGWLSIVMLDLKHLNTSGFTLP